MIERELDDSQIEEQPTLPERRYAAGLTAMAIGAALSSPGMAGLITFYPNGCGPESRRPKHRGTTIGTRDGKPFQDSKGKWYYFDDKGCMRRYNHAAVTSDA